MQRARSDRRLELARRPLGDDLAVVDDRDPVGELVGLLEVLRAQQDRRALGDERADDAPDLVARARVQPGRRLVEEHELGRHDDARRDVEPAPHPAGEVLDELAGRLRQPERVEQLAGAVLRRLAAQPEQAADEDEVLAAGEVLVDGRELAGEAHEPAHGVGVVDDVVAEHARAAGVGRSSVARMRIVVVLPAPLGPQAVDRAAADAQVDAVDGARLAERLPRPVASIASEGVDVTVSVRSSGLSLHYKTANASQNSSRARVDRRSAPWDCSTDSAGRTGRRRLRPARRRPSRTDAEARPSALLELARAGEPLDRQRRRSPATCAPAASPRHRRRRCSIARATRSRSRPTRAARRATRIGGEPLLPAGEAWPREPGGGPLTFIAAIDSTSCQQMNGEGVARKKNTICLHDAIIGEMERGTMLLLLSYPVGRWQVLFGKFVGHLAILAFATLLGYGAAAGALAATGTAIDAESWAAFGAMVASSVLLGAVFIAVGYLVSALARDRGTAGGIAVGIWLMFVLIYDMAFLGLLVVDQGQTVSGSVLNALLLLNPTDVYRLFNLTGFDSVRSFSGMAGLANSTTLTSATLLVALAAWALVPLALAAFAFSRREL